MKVAVYTDRGMKVYVAIWRIVTGQSRVTLERGGSVDADVTIWRDEILKLEVYP